VVGSYPDPDFTTKAGRKLDQELDKHAIDHDIKIYPEAKHSFFTKRASDHDKAAADDSWRRVLAFFEEHIR
jgi:carboxymethylenebutenolidase